MKSSFQVALAGIAGLMIGAAGTSVLNAATTTAPAFIVAERVSVHDPDMIKEYAAKVPQTQIPFGGHALARGAAPVMLDNSPQPKGTFAIIAFPSMKNLKDWWNSPAYSAVRSLREKSSTTIIYAVEGLPPS